MSNGEALVKSTGPDGGEYLLVIEGTERWVIRLDGALVAAGPTDEAGIINAIATFRGLPVAQPQPGSGRLLGVHALLT